jgi:hypothetical protein
MQAHSAIVRLLRSLCLSLAGSALLAPGWVHADPIYLLLESDEDRPAGQEVFLATYDNLDDFFAADFADIGFTAIDIAADFSIAGFTFSDTGFHLLLQSNEDRPAGQEVFLATYNTIDDFFAADFATIGFTAIDIAADFGIAGFTFSDTGYHLLLESKEDRPAGQEVFLATYDTIDDFIAADFATIGFTAIDIAADFSIAGFTFSDTGYHLLLQSDEDRPAGQEVFLASYNTIDDFIAANFASIGFTAIDIAADFSIRGFTMEFELGDPDVRVSEPSSISTLLLGVLGLILARLHWWSRRRHSQRPQGGAVGLTAG